MKIPFRSILICSIFFSFLGNAFSQSSYKEMLDDPSVNFYDACAAADLYFEIHDPNVKGSGWKDYQRWKYANEYKFYPSGDRSQADPFFAEHAYQAFLAQNPAQAAQRLFNNGWSELGPFRVDSITGHYAAGMGRVEDLYVDPNNMNRIYLGSRSGGFWKTLDGGNTWSGGLTDFLASAGVNTITVSPTNPDSILINVRNARNGYSHGIFRSTDGGNSFVLSNFNPTNIGFGGLGSNFAIYRIAYHPSIPNLVFIGTSNGLYRSDDNLATWVLMMPTSDVVRIEFHPTNANIVYVYDGQTSKRNFVFYSFNAGVSFTQSNVIPGNNGAYGILSISNDCANCVYFASDNGVWRSLDNGQNFVLLGNAGAGSGGFAVNDQDTSKMVHGYVDLVTTSNSCQTFNQVSWWSLGSSQHGSGSFQDRFLSTTKYVHADLRVARSINGVFYVGTDGYICSSSDNGNTWLVRSQGTSVRENYSLGTSQSDHYRTVCGSQDNGTSIRVKDLWVEFYGADGMEAIIHPLNYHWLMGSYQYGGRRLSKNGGLTSSSGHPTGESGAGIADWIAPLAYDPNDHMTLYHFSKSVWKSEDFGTNWTQLGSPVSFTSEIAEAAIAENNTNIMVVSRGNAIDKSTDGGLTFSSIKNNLPNATITDIAFDPNDDNVIAVTYASYQNNGQKIFLTTNGGGFWANITGNIGNLPFHAVVIDHSDSSNIYVGAEIGIYVKSMAGNTWNLYNPNFPNTSVYEMEINYGSNTLKAATWGRGLWEYNLKDRADYPAILKTDIDDLPTENLPVFGSQQFVTSVISYANTLSSVYVAWSVNTPTFGNVIQMTNSVDSTWKSVTALPQYPIGTKLYFKVFAVGNNNDTTETYKFMYTVRPYSLCGGSGSSGTGSDYINYVSLNGVSKSSGQDYYGNFTNTYIPLYKDSTYTIQVNLNFAFGPDLCGAWIDYNRNGIFSPDEAISMSTFSSNQSTGTFTVPSSVNVGDTVLMRVRNSYNATPDPCGVVAGEVEDYSIIFRDSSCTSTYSTLNPDVCGPTYIAPDGAAYNSSGVYSATIANAVGCDSIITVNLTLTTLNTAVTSGSGTLTAAATGVTYQWLDCDLGYAAIFGANGSSFSPMVSGNYAVQISDGVCQDTSACTNVIITGLAGSLDLEAILFPNPTSSAFQIELGVPAQNLWVRVTDVTGKTLYQKEEANTQSIKMELNIVSGIYFVEVVADGKMKVFKLQKED